MHIDTKGNNALQYRMNKYTQAQMQLDIRGGSLRNVDYIVNIMYSVVLGDCLITGRKRDIVKMPP